MGDELVPVLVASADDKEHFDETARARMQQLVRYFHDGLGAGDDDLAWGQPHPLRRERREMIMNGAASAPPMRVGQPLAVMSTEPQDVPIEGFKTVKVFYGTNRRPVDAVVGARQLVRWETAGASPRLPRENNIRDDV